MRTRLRLMATKGFTIIKVNSLAWTKEGKVAMTKGSLNRKWSKRVSNTCESITVTEIMLKLLVKGLLDPICRFLEDVKIVLKSGVPQTAQPSIKAPNGQEK